MPVLIALVYVPLWLREKWREYRKFSFANRFRVLNISLPFFNNTCQILIMSTDTPAHPESLGLQSMTIPTIAVICEILANCFIIWFLLIDIPTKCAHLAAETAGTQTCGMEIGGYVIAMISALLILAGVYFLAKWHFPQEP